MRAFDPEIARIEDDLDRSREDDPGTGEDDAPAEAEKEQLYESYLNRMAAAEKAWPKTPEGKAATDRVQEAQKECERSAGDAGLIMPKPEEPNPEDREEIY